jgi:glycerol uptake facilitator protein
MSKASKQLLGEFFASFFLGFLGLGVVVSMVVYGSVTGMVQFAISFALIIATVITAFNKISGAHFNPSVTIAFAVFGKFPKKMVIPYVLAQILGWCAGALMLYAVFGPAITQYELAHGIVRGSPESAATAGIFFCSTANIWNGLLAEFAMTFVLLLAVCSFIDENNPNRPSPELFPILLALLVGFLVMFGGSISGTALNFARDFGPRVAAWLLGWGNVAFPGVWWVYLVGPVAGGICGVGFYEKIMSKWLI